MQITIQDQQIGGPITHEMVIDFLTEEITLRDLIKSRVYQEAKDANVTKGNHPLPMLKLTEIEQTLNPLKKKKKGKAIDFQEQYDKAIDAFDKNRYFVLVDDFQPTKLDDKITLKPDTKVNFVRLVFLAGG
ncbi:MAG: hypothetical protein ACYTEU_07770 [Planctomycetota bacterium]|jgi:hypothetical protein